MDDNNQNKTNPFGAYRYGDGGPNRPRDISSDLWTPISTGVPMPGTGKLQDENETPPAARPALLDFTILFCSKVYSGFSIMFTHQEAKE